MFFLIFKFSEAPEPEPEKSDDKIEDIVEEHMEVRRISMDTTEKVLSPEEQKVQKKFFLF